MKKLFYFIYAVFFNIGRIFPIKSNRIAFVAPHNGGDNDSLGALRAYAEKNGGYSIINVTTRDLSPDFSSIRSAISSCLKAAGFFTLNALRISRAKYVFLNDNFMPMANLKFSKKTVVTQLWHAEGAFKKFGLSAPLTDEVRRREEKCAEKLSYVICTSKNIVPIYAEAFGVDESKILPLGSPRTDALINCDGIQALRDEFDSAHEECRGKKLVLYAPTFRDDSEKDKRILENIDIKAFERVLGGEYRLLTRLHPQIHSAEAIDGATDVTDYCDINTLTLISDALITDYSSVCMDFALLGKPCVFFAFDLEEYEKERSFYFDYESYVPGAVVRDFASALEAIKNPRSSSEKLLSFRDFNFDYIDGESTRRVFEQIISANS